MKLSTALSSVLFSIALFTGSAYATLDQAPPSFPFGGGEAVYVDFESAKYSIVYDAEKKNATVESEIEFKNDERGYPIFDLVSTPTDLRLDGDAATATVTSDPDGRSKMQVLNTQVNRGHHTLTMKHVLTTGVNFREKGVASAFWMSDLDDREYLEQYLPTNLEFDQIPMSIRVEVTGAAGVPHVLRANGNVQTLSENVFTVEFPKFYTTSSMFFHVLPVNAVPSMKFEFASVDGRKLPVEIYSNGNLSSFAAEAKSVLNELEKDYGPFPHEKVIIYGAGSGGMEYSGATVTSLSALGHELFHSYNARAVMPAQGNAGWIDEAMSSWRDRDYSLHTNPGSTTKMAGHSKWERMTDDDAYSAGADFLSWIGSRMQAKGQDLKAFLREYFGTHFYTTVTTGMFQSALEQYTGMDLKSDFTTYIYGSSPGKPPLGSNWPRKLGLDASSSHERAENAYHPRLTRAQLDALLWP